MQFLLFFPYTTAFTTLLLYFYLLYRTSGLVKDSKIELSFQEIIIVTSKVFEVTSKMCE